MAQGEVRQNAPVSTPNAWKKSLVIMPDITASSTETAEEIIRLRFTQLSAGEFASEFLMNSVGNFTLPEYRMSGLPILRERPTSKASFSLSMALMP